MTTSFENPRPTFANRWVRVFFHWLHPDDNGSNRVSFYLFFKPIAFLLRPSAYTYDQSVFVALQRHVKAWKPHTFGVCTGNDMRRTRNRHINDRTTCVKHLNFIVSLKVFQCFPPRGTFLSIISLLLAIWVMPQDILYSTVIYLI